jgi:hypothetical protein
MGFPLEFRNMETEERRTVKMTLSEIYQTGGNVIEGRSVGASGN